MAHSHFLLKKLYYPDIAWLKVKHVIPYMNLTESSFNNYCFTTFFTNCAPSVSMEMK